MKRLSIKRTPPKPADFRCKSAPQYPYNKKPVSPELSAPMFGVSTQRDVYISVSDGTQISLDIYQPDQEGKYPVWLFVTTTRTDAGICGWSRVKSGKTRNGKMGFPTQG